VFVAIVDHNPERRCNLKEGLERRGIVTSSYAYMHELPKKLDQKNCVLLLHCSNNQDDTTHALEKQGNFRDIGTVMYSAAGAQREKFKKHHDQFPKHLFRATPLPANELEQEHFAGIVAGMVKRSEAAAVDEWSSYQETLNEVNLKLESALELLNRVAVAYPEDGGALKTYLGRAFTAKSIRTEAGGLIDAYLVADEAERQRHLEDLRDCLLAKAYASS
jgi:hypothetical protein